jgi:hypothetical protein
VGEIQVNKRNFGRVIKRIEKYPHLHEQGVDPVPSATACGSPYCFIGHAEFIRTRGKSITPISGFISDVDNWKPEDPLLAWLGMDAVEAHTIYWKLGATLDDFKRWHKAGKVS